MSHECHRLIANCLNDIGSDGLIGGPETAMNIASAINFHQADIKVSQPTFFVIGTSERDAQPGRGLPDDSARGAIRFTDIRLG